MGSAPWLPSKRLYIDSMWSPAKFIAMYINNNGDEAVRGQRFLINKIGVLFEFFTNWLDNISVYVKFNGLEDLCEAYRDF